MKNTNIGDIPGSDTNSNKSPVTTRTEAPLTQNLDMNHKHPLHTGRVIKGPKS